MSNDHPHPAPTCLTPCFELGGLRKIRTNLGPAGRGDQSICNQGMRKTVLKSGADGERGQDLAMSDGSRERRYSSQSVRAQNDSGTWRRGGRRESRWRAQM